MRTGAANDTCEDKHRERTQDGVEVYTFEQQFDNKQLVQTTIARYRRVKKKGQSARATMVCIVRIRGSVPDTLYWLGP